MALITVTRDSVMTDGPLRELAINASISGATITHTGEHNHYLVEDSFLTPEAANGILMVAGASIADYKIIRYISTDTLESEFALSIPNSSTTEGEGDEEATRQLTFAEVDARADRSISQYSDGLYYCKASICGDCRGLTLDQYNELEAGGVAMIVAADLPAAVETLD